MGKMLGMALLSVFIIEIGLTFFAGDTITNSALYLLLIEPTAITSSAFYLVMLGVVAGTVIAVVTPGFIYQINQWALFAGASATGLTFVITLGHLWGYIYSQITPFTVIGEPFAVLISTIITAPLIIFYITAMIEWSRFNQ